MEPWFVLAVVAAIVGGIPPFLVKVAAKRDYDAGLFILLGSIAKALIIVPLVLVWGDWEVFHIIPVLLGFLVGLVAVQGAIMRVLALRHVDATIYFPLNKVLSPVVVIAAGILLFSESFTFMEWLGLLGGIFVPLLLISRGEHTRQSNLRAGLILIVITALISAFGAIVNKFTLDTFADTALWILAGNACGALLGSLYKYWRTQGSLAMIIPGIRVTDGVMIKLSLVRGLLLIVSLGSGLYALALGGPVGIVYTIGALYILIPILLSIIFYNEHWNLQKALAIVLSVVSLAFLG